MLIQENSNDGGRSITSYGNGTVEVDHRPYTRPICITEQSVNTLPQAAPTELQTEDFLNAIRGTVPPEVILVGTGDKQIFLHPKMVAELAANGVGLESMSTPSACRTFSILQSEGRRVWAWLWP
ncbi:Mth938-like domain-containing protein [Neisseria weaveri]|uniref:Protein of uncharacterized function (DUF498/DUF598) n=1 Tax=Neisseria weaveri TaxID=28091 RepID=A0A448VQE6_9NEIS|nr:MTH938/NDUFAF3 family protein [Neisseria weaveri]EGV36162.1 hypothetical protein l11_18580 [Neisseria weaveri LMG 5135]SAY50533.1 Protein of uncharacterised function (DUF498/DUF598) [Neisseria weaveri]VEJ51942.1 Protein of uncharacterised function (DUF498/DUF598) [Neisseria weaveri]